MSSNSIKLSQARYELLQNDNKIVALESKPRNKKLCVITAVILLTVTLIGIIFLIVNLQYFVDGFHLPYTYQSEEFPSHWLKRAVKYNSRTVNGSQDKSNLSHAKSVQKRVEHSTRDYKLVCYYTVLNASDSRSSAKFLYTNQLDAHLCTHINVGFVPIINNSIGFTSVLNQTLKNITALKQENKKLKILLSIGGASDESGYAQMVLNQRNRKTFIRSVVGTLKAFKLDGIDLDWEFPNENPGGDKHQRMHFTQLLRELRAEIQRHEVKRRFLLSVAVAAPEIIVDNSYDISYMNEYVDFVNLMSYDFHFYTTFTPFTGLNAPLYTRSDENGYFKNLNINSSAYYWHVSGMDKSKIIIGLPTYGHSFELMNTENNGLMAPAKGYGQVGHLGFVDYSDICWFLNHFQIQPIFDTETKSPYAFKATEWISYDNMKSLTYKTEFIKYNNFGGAMILSLNTDDFRGNCESYRHGAASVAATGGNNVTFPLTRTVKDVLYDEQL